MAGSPRHGPHEIQNLLNARGLCRLGTYCVQLAGRPVRESPKTCWWLRGATGVAHGYRPSRWPRVPQVQGWLLARSQYVPVMAIRFRGIGGVQATFRESSHTYLVVR